MIEANSLHTPKAYQLQWQWMPVKENTIKSNMINTSPKCIYLLLNKPEAAVTWVTVKQALHLGFAPVRKHAATLTKDSELLFK